VFSKVIVLQQVRIAKLMAIWDYEGKLESGGWNRAQSLQTLKARLSASPAKMLLYFTQSVCNAILVKLDAVPHGVLENEALPSLPGFMHDVPFSPLEEKATTQIMAAQANDAKVELNAWSLPPETAEEAKSQVILCDFVIRWWTHIMKREDMRWWMNQNGQDPKNLAAIHNCVFQAHACSYCQWHQGLQLFFWRFPPEFQEQMRDKLCLSYCSMPG
jgi:hypothetical protein